MKYHDMFAQLLKATNLTRCLAIFRVPPHQITTYAHSRLPKNRDKSDWQAWYSLFLQPFDFHELAECGFWKSPQSHLRRFGLAKPL